jgi:hypothetical protein
MNPLGAAIIAICGGVGMYNVLHYGLSVSSVGSGVGGVVFYSILFAALTIQD